MRILIYFLLLLVILSTAINSWGETDKTIMYTIAILGIFGLIFLELTEKKAKKDRKSK